MKKEKAAGIDEIPMEAWIYGGTVLRKRLVEIIREVWRTGVTPKDWETSVIVPIFKKWNEEETENYRGISLLCMAYKIYAEILRGRLEESITRAELLPES